MPKSLDPRVSEFDTEVDEERHDRWVREQVGRGLADTDATAPHDEVMAEMEAIIERAEQRRSQDR